MDRQSKIQTSLTLNSQLLTLNSIPYFSLPMEILIVEDEAEIAQLIQLYMEKEGFSCRVCRDGNQALQVFQEHKPDLIILDLMIPGLDGLEVCARIRQQPGPKDPYILMLTARGRRARSYYWSVYRGGRLYGQALQPQRTGSAGAGPSTT